MTKAMTILALTCFLIVGAAASSILGRDSVPSARQSIASADFHIAVANRESKTDKLAPPTLMLASLEPVTQAEPVPSPEAAQAEPLLTEPLRQALTASSPAEAEIPKIEAPKIEASKTEASREAKTERATSTTMAAVTVAAPMPRLPAKPAPQKTYALLSDIQIAGIRDRLKLSPDQESYWPAVENALRGISRRLQANRLSNPNTPGTQIDPDSTEVQQLKSAAMPLLFGLREDQKREVRSLARLIGLERVASMI